LLAFWGALQSPSPDNTQDGVTLMPKVAKKKVAKKAVKKVVKKKVAKKKAKK
jgi:hypothetical protein